MTILLFLSVPILKLVGKAQTTITSRLVMATVFSLKKMLHWSFSYFEYPFNFDFFTTKTVSEMILDYH